LTPEYIFDNWTDEKLIVLIDDYIERNKIEVDNTEEIDDSLKFRRMGIKYLKK